MKLEYVGKNGLIEHGSRRLRTGDVIELSDRDGASILGRYSALFKDVTPASAPPAAVSKKVKPAPAPEPAPTPAPEPTSAPAGKETSK